MRTLGRIYANAGVMVRCGGGVGWVKCRRKFARDGTWEWLRASDGALPWGTGALTCRRKYVGADTYIC